MKTALLVCLILFIYVAGQSVADYLTVPGYILFGLVWGWVLLRDGHIGGPAMLGLLAIMIGVAVGQVSDELAQFAALHRGATVIGYVGVYNLFNLHRLNLSKPLALAGGIVALLSVTGIFIGNPNIVAGFVFLTAPQALAVWRDVRGWYTTALGAAALILSGSQGAWIAMGVAALVYTRRWWGLGFVPILGAIQAVWHPVSVADRLYVWKQAISHHLAPLGCGLGAAVWNMPNGEWFYHSHSLPVTVAVETGIPGLAALGWGLWRLVPRLGRGWQGAVLAGLLAWSLIDEVVWFWGPGLAAVYLIAEVMREEE